MEPAFMNIPLCLELPDSLPSLWTRFSSIQDLKVKAEKASSSKKRKLKDEEDALEDTGMDAGGDWEGVGTVGV
jgi:hypothetical protein